MQRKVFNLERDIRKTEWVVDKIRSRESYAQNLYAALCNNSFAPKDVWSILSSLKWDCTWAYAAHMVSDIREDESYHSWYCSGAGYINYVGYVEESIVTDEVYTDFDSIGWVTIVNIY